MLKRLFITLTSFRSIFFIALASTAVYFILKTLIFLDYSSPIGDEIYFLKIHDLIEKNGFFSAWSSGNFSPVFYLITVPLELLFKDALMCYRTVSTIATLASILLLYRFGTSYLKLKPKYVCSAMVFILSFLAYRIYWQGINDSLFHLLIIASFFPMHNIYFKKDIKKNTVILGVIIGLLMGTRVLAFLVLPGYIFFFWKDVKTGFKVAIIGLSVGLLFHLPALYENHSLCSIDKNPNNGMTWIQKNYVSQQLIYEGKLRDGDRITWESLQHYIDEYGSNHLPNSFFEIATSKPNWLMKEFFKDFWFSLKRIFPPALGLGLLVFLIFPFFAFKHRHLLTKNLKFAQGFMGFFWLHTCLIALVVLVQIEVRWFTAFIYLAILFYHHIVQDFRLIFNAKWQDTFLKLNLFVLILYQLSFIVFDSNPLRKWGIAYIKSLNWM